MSEGSFSPEGGQPNKPRAEGEKASDFPGPESFYGTPEYDMATRYLDIIPTDEEMSAMQEWKARNQETLSKLSRPKQRKAYFDALQELLAQRAREQIHQASPDEAAEPDSGSTEGA